MAEYHPQLLKVLIRQVGKDAQIDPIVGKQLGIL
jgi:hypothetical protein